VTPTGATASDESRASAVGSLLVAMLSFQAGASIAKGLMSEIGAPGTTALRLAISAPILCIAQRPWRAVPSLAAARVIVLYGLSLGTMNFVFYSALNRIPLGIAVGLEFTGPLAVALVASHRRIDLLWLVFAVIGVLCLLPTSTGAGHIDLVGVAFALAAGVCWALYIVFGQKAGRAHGATATTWGMLVASTVVAPIGIWHAGPSLTMPGVLPRGVAVAVLSSALPYVLEMIALRRLSAKTYGTLMSLEPAVAALAGLLLLRENLSAVQWAGIAAVMVASAGTLGHEPMPDQVP
jgi:inner membrane transporter RhtA